MAPLMLSVSGARGIVGASMTPVVAARFSAAWATQLLSADGARARTPRPRMVLGRDGRGSGDALARAAAGAIMAVGCEVVDAGIAATPTIGVAIRHHNAIGGIVITASHNPVEWNGLKALDADGLAPPPELAGALIARFHEDRIEWTGPLGAGAHCKDADADLRHVERVLQQVDRAAIAAVGYRVVLDSVNGGGAASGRLLLERLGCQVTQLNGDHAGEFAHTPEPLEANLGQLMRAVASDSRASVGFAQDPDADRLAIIDEMGGYMGEECTLALGARRMLERCGGGTICTNLSTSRMVDDLCAAVPGARVVRSAVGEANVVAAMRTHGAMLGGEGNGGVILPGVCWIRDSLSAMALTLELMATSGQPLSALHASLPRYSMVKRKLSLEGIGGRAALDGMLARVRSAFPHAAHNAVDGLRLDLPEGWVHLRASNTEPIVRLIGEGRSAEEAASLCDAVGRAAGIG